MYLHLHEYIIIGIYIVAILGIGEYFSKKGSSNINEYFLAGKKLPWWVLGVSFMTSNLDLTGTMVIASFFAMVGLKGFLVELRGGTCLPLALFMVFMAKWHRRAGVMTIAEWMEFRFGSNKGAQAARITSAIAVITLVIAMMTYFAVGFGKFLSMYIPLSPTANAVIFTSLSTIHTLFAGLYGVVYTDVIQGLMVLFIVVFISVLAFINPPDLQAVQSAWETLGVSMEWEDWTSITPSWKMNFPADYAIYNLFGFSLMFWILRIFLEGFGGPLIPYAAQRFFAAKNERDAALITASSLALFVIRWPLIIGVALLGLGLGASIPKDPEMVFPAVVSHYFPEGLRGVMVACLMAAAMSTYDSTVNAGAAYVVNDIYHRYINPKASTKQLVRISSITTIVLTAVCLLLSTVIPSINYIWSWISMSLFGGMAIPLVMRWYWERMNGWGYTIGTLAGILASILQMIIYPELPEYYQLGIVGLVSFIACVVGTYLTEPIDENTLLNFYRKTRPMGFWKKTRSKISEEERRSIDEEHKWDLISGFFAIIGFFFFFLTPMYFVLHKYKAMAISGIITTTCAVALYFTWYKKLSYFQELREKFLKDKEM